MNQIARKEHQMIEAFELEQIKDQVNDLLGGNMQKIQAFKSNLINLSMNGQLVACSPQSIIKSGLHALSLNLPIKNGQGYVVKYGKEATFDIGYKGWQVLAKRSGLLVEADIVYDCDTFKQMGFGHQREFEFVPNYDERDSSNDKWAKEHLTGVIVSIHEPESGMASNAFVDADKIFKIVGYSPSAGQKSKKDGKYYSPHDKWAEEMFRAKAVKYVVSKWPVDIAISSQLSEAIEVVNQTESLAQAQQMGDKKSYTDEEFDDKFETWAELVESGAKPASVIVKQIRMMCDLTSDQYDRIGNLFNLEPIEGEVTEGDESAE